MSTRTSGVVNPAVRMGQYTALSYDDLDGPVAKADIIRLVAEGTGAETLGTVVSVDPNEDVVMVEVVDWAALDEEG